jgi:hypothetical protein
MDINCRVWVASEWMIHCADKLLKRINSKEKDDGMDARAHGTGPLCKGIPPLSVKRWEFWKKRFAEFATEAGSLELDSATTVHIADALKSMDTAESMYAVKGVDIAKDVNAESVDAAMDLDAAKSTNAEEK